MRQGYDDWLAYTRARNNAHCAVQRALREGRLTKPERCEHCSEVIPRQRLQGHHHRGYEHRLDVIWLCQPCHKAADGYSGKAQPLQLTLMQDE